MHFSKAASASLAQRGFRSSIERMHAYIEIRAHASHSQHSTEVEVVHALSASSHVPEVAALLA